MMSAIIVITLMELCIERQIMDLKTKHQQLRKYKFCLSINTCVNAINHPGVFCMRCNRSPAPSKLIAITTIIQTTIQTEELTSLFQKRIKTDAALSSAGRKIIQLNLTGGSKSAVSRSLINNCHTNNSSPWQMKRQGPRNAQLILYGLRV